MVAETKMVLIVVEYWLFGIYRLFDLRNIEEGVSPIGAVAYHDNFFLDWLLGHGFELTFGNGIGNIHTLSIVNPLAVVGSKRLIALSIFFRNWPV